MRVSNFAGDCVRRCWWRVLRKLGADEPFGGLDDSPRFMLYVHKEVGTVRHKSTGPAFGFAVDRPIPLTLQRDQSALLAPTARIFDLRVAPFDDNAIFLNGFSSPARQQAARLQGSYGEGESGSGAGETPGCWSHSSSGVRSASRALTDNFPCDDSYDGEDAIRCPANEARHDAGSALLAMLSGCMSLPRNVARSSNRCSTIIQITFRSHEHRSSLVFASARRAGRCLGERLRDDAGARGVPCLRCGDGAVGRDRVSRAAVAVGPADRQRLRCGRTACCCRCSASSIRSTGTQASFRSRTASRTFTKASQCCGRSCAARRPTRCAGAFVA